MDFYGKTHGQGPLGNVKVGNLPDRNTIDSSEIRYDIHYIPEIESYS